MRMFSKGRRILGEPDAHVMMRHAKTIIRILLVVAMVLAVLLFVYLRPAAYLAALPIPVLFLAYVWVGYLEWQSRVRMLRVPDQTVISKREVEMDVQYAGIYTAMGLMLLIAVTTFTIAVTIAEDWAMVGPSAAVLLLLGVMIVLPYLPLLIQDASKDERDKLEKEAAVDESLEKAPESIEPIAKN